MPRPHEPLAKPAQEAPPNNSSQQNYLIIFFCMQTRTFFAALGIALTVALAPSKTHAATTFTFDQSIDGLSNFSLTEDGITLTVSNFISDINVSVADGDGLCIAGFLPGNFCEDQSSLSLAFNTPVRLISYLTGFNDLGGASATLSFTQNSNTSTQTSFPIGIFTPFNNQFTAAAGVPIVTARTSNATDPSALQFSQLTVEQVSNTVPGPVSLAGAAIALSWSRKLRHRVSSR
jgi:hypothetical protein